MRNYSRFIPGEEIDAVAEWRFGDVDAAVEQLARQAEAKADAPAPSELARQQRQEGYAEGFAQGRAQALLEAQRQINEFLDQQGQTTARELAGLVESSRTQLDSLAQSAAQEVLDLACELARQVLRHEIEVNPKVLLPVVREALGMLVTDSRKVRVRLHPKDLALMQETMQAEFPELTAELQVDPALARGGCLIESGSTQVDASMGVRWRRAVGLLGRDLAWTEATDGS